MILELEPQLPEIARLQREVEAFGLEHGLNEEAIFDLTLAVEEIVTNVILYAFDTPGEHRVRLEIKSEGGEVIASVIDDGRPFDPLQKPEPDLSKPIEERPIGGLGIFLTKKLMDEVTYERRDGRNILTMRKRFPPLP